MAEGDNNSQAAADLEKQFESLAGAVGKTAAIFMTRTPTIKDALDIFGELGGIGKLLKGVGGQLEGQIKMWRDLSHYGINFGNQLDQMQLSAAKAGLSNEQFANLLTKNSEMLAALGPTATQGTTDFLDAVAKFRTATFELAGEQRRYSEQLQRLGFDFEDMAENMAYLETLQTMSARRTFMNDNIRNQAAFEFAEQLDILSKLTGKQSDQLRDEMAKRAREGDYQAFLAGLNPEEAQAVMAAQAQAEAAGFGDLFKDYMIRGFPSEDQRLLAGMSGEMVGLFEDMSAARKSGNLGEFNRLANGIMVTGSATQMANRDLAMLGNTTRATSAAMQMFADSSPAMAKFRQALQQYADANGMSVDQIDRATRERLAAEALAAAKAEQDAQQRDRRPGSTDSAAITNALVGIEAALVDAGAAVQQEAVTKLYDQMLTPAAIEFTEFLRDPENRGRLRATFGVIPGGGNEPTSVGNMPGLPQSNFDSFLSSLGQLDAQKAVDIGRIQSQLANATDEAEKTRLQAELRSQIESAIASNPSLRSPFGSTAPTVDAMTIQATNVYINGTPTQMNNGTIGAFGSILNDFGKESLAALHGNEAVLNENQLTNLANGLYNSGSQSAMPQLQGMLNTIRPQMQQMAASIAPQMQNSMNQMLPQLENMANQMQGPMKEMAESLRGPMESMAGNMQKQVTTAMKQLRTQRALPGNLFQGIKI